MLAKCLMEGIVVLAWKPAASSNCVAAVHFVMTSNPLLSLQCGAYFASDFRYKQSHVTSDEMCSVYSGGHLCSGVAAW